MLLEARHTDDRERVAAECDDLPSRKSLLRDVVSTRRERQRECVCACVWVGKRREARESRERESRRGCVSCERAELSESTRKRIRSDTG